MAHRPAFLAQNMNNHSYVLTNMHFDLTLGKAMREQAVTVCSLPKFDEAAMCSTKKGI